MTTDVIRLEDLNFNHEGACVFHFKEGRNPVLLEKRFRVEKDLYYRREYKPLVLSGKDPVTIYVTEDRDCSLETDRHTICTRLHQWPEVEIVWNCPPQWVQSQVLYLRGQQFRSNIRVLQVLSLIGAKTLPPGVINLKLSKKPFEIRSCEPSKIHDLSTGDSSSSSAVPKKRRSRRSVQEGARSSTITLRTGLPPPLYVRTDLVRPQDWVKLGDRSFEELSTWPEELTNLARTFAGVTRYMSTAGCRSSQPFSSVLSITNIPLEKTKLPARNSWRPPTEGSNTLEVSSSKPRTSKGDAKHSIVVSTPFRKRKGSSPQSALTTSSSPAVGLVTSTAVSHSSNSRKVSLKTTQNLTSDPPLLVSPQEIPLAHRRQSYRKGLSRISASSGCRKRKPIKRKARSSKASKAILQGKVVPSLPETESPRLRLEDANTSVQAMTPCQLKAEEVKKSLSHAVGHRPVIGQNQPPGTQEPGPEFPAVNPELDALRTLLEPRGITMQPMTREEVERRRNNKASLWTGQLSGPLTSPLVIEIPGQESVPVSQQATSIPRLGTALTSRSSILPRTGTPTSGMSEKAAVGKEGDPGKPEPVTSIGIRQAMSQGLLMKADVPNQAVNMVKREVTVTAGACLPSVTPQKGGINPKPSVSSSDPDCQVDAMTVWSEAPFKRRLRENWQRGMRLHKSEPLVGGVKTSTGKYSSQSATLSADRCTCGAEVGKLLCKSRRHTEPADGLSNQKTPVILVDKLSISSQASTHQHFGTQSRPGEKLGQHSQGIKGAELLPNSDKLIPHHQVGTANLTSDFSKPAHQESGKELQQSLPPLESTKAVSLSAPQRATVFTSDFKYLTTDVAPGNLGLASLTRAAAYLAEAHPGGCEEDVFKCVNPLSLTTSSPGGSTFSGTDPGSAEHNQVSKAVGGSGRGRLSTLSVPGRPAPGNASTTTAIPIGLNPQDDLANCLDTATPEDLEFLRGSFTHAIQQISAMPVMRNVFNEILDEA